jgi:hypothetical protein
VYFPPEKKEGMTMRSNRYLNNWAAQLIKLWQDLPIKPCPPTPPPLIEIEKKPIINYRLILMTRRAELLQNSENAEPLNKSDRNKP